MNMSAIAGCWADGGWLENVKVAVENFLALTSNYLNVDCIGYRLMAPSAFRLIPYKPSFQYAILSATGHNFTRKNLGSIYSTRHSFFLISQ